MARSEAGLMPNGQDGVPHHSHWLGTQVPGGPGQPSRSVAYYDAASLYPSSGEFFFFFFFREEVLSFLVRERILSFLTLPKKREFFILHVFCLFLTPSKKSLDFLEIYFSLLSVVLQNCEMFPWAREPCTWSIDESLEGIIQDAD